MSGRRDYYQSNYSSNGGVSYNYDPNKIFNKINNNFIQTSPNFDLMTSRPISKPNDPLPFYMKVI